jgi:hypothetical protein
MDTEQLYEIGQLYQQELEKAIINPFGICHLSAYCITENLKNKGINAASVTGHLSLRDKKGKEILYSSENPTAPRNIGYYHTWCEVIIKDTKFILDASLKYNIQFIMLQHKRKIHPKIPPLLISQQFQTYYWKYTEDEKLLHLSQNQLDLIPEKVKIHLINSF